MELQSHGILALEGTLESKRARHVGAWALGCDSVGSDPILALCSQTRCLSFHVLEKIIYSSQGYHKDLIMKGLP